MTKLVMMIVLACTVLPAVGFAQDEEINNNLPPIIFKDFKRRNDTGDFQNRAFFEQYEAEEVTGQFLPRLVCTKADMPRPGARFAYGPCVENIRLRIPLNNSPAWDCEQVHGVGNCLLVDVPGGFEDTSQITEFGLTYLKTDPYYVPKCKQGFRLYFVFHEVGDLPQPLRFRRYCARPKNPTNN